MSELDGDWSHTTEADELRIGNQVVGIVRWLPSACCLGDSYDHAWKVFRVGEGYCANYGHALGMATSKAVVEGELKRLGVDYPKAGCGGVHHADVSGAIAQALADELSELAWTVRGLVDKWRATERAQRAAGSPRANGSAMCADDFSTLLTSLRVNASIRVRDRRAEVSE